MNGTNLPHEGRSEVRLLLERAFGLTKQAEPLPAAVQGAVEKATIAHVRAQSGARPAIDWEGLWHDGESSELLLIIAYQQHEARAREDDDETILLLTL